MLVIAFWYSRDGLTKSYFSYFRKIIKNFCIFTKKIAKIRDFAWREIRKFFRKVSRKILLLWVPPLVPAGSMCVPLRRTFGLESHMTWYTNS